MGNAFVGIDLGTRYSILACVDDDGSKVIKNRWGRERTPSFVACDRGSLWAGEDALSIACAFPQKSCCDLKRRLGSSEKIYLKDMSFKPEELLRVLLLYLREDCEAYLRELVKGCCVAVPSSFDFRQRETIKTAAQMAGFEAVKLVNEPTAVVLSANVEGSILVFDFGAGAIDISAVEKEGDICHVLENAGMDQFGGMDLDREVAFYLWRLVKAEGDPEADPRWPLLLIEAEKIREALSFADSVDWWPRASGLGFGENVSLTIHRDEIEEIISPLVKPAIDLAKEIWDRYNCQKLLLAGGCTRMPLIRRSLGNAVAEPPKVRACTDEAVAVGAALLGGKKGKLLVDTLSCDLAMETADGGLSVIAPRGTPLPLRVTKRFMVVGTGRIESEVLQIKDGPDGPSRETLCPVFIEGAKSGDVVVVALSVDAGGLLTVEISGDEGELFVSRTLNVLDRSSEGQIFNERSRKLEELERKFARYSYLFDADLECRVTQLFEYVKCLQWSDDELWKDAFSVLELASDRIARAVKYR